jgi:hypothetical protein
MKQQKLIGIYEIIGGLWGIFITLLNYINSEQSILIFLVILTPFCMVTLAGVLLFQNQKAGIILTVIIQIIQILSFSGNIKYIFCSGPEIGILIDKNIEFSFVFILAQFAIGYNSSIFFIKINIIPMLILIWLFLSVKKN